MFNRKRSDFMFNIKKAVKNNEGFSLVEMIVVIAIMVVIITALVSRTVGYIKKAEEMSAMNTMKVMVDSMEIALVQHAADGNPIVAGTADRYGVQMRADKSYKPVGDEQFVDAGAITSWMFHTAQNNTTKFDTVNDKYDIVIVNEILEAIRSEKGAKKPRLKFANKKPFGYQAAQYKKETHNLEGVLFIYSPSGAVFASQMTMGKYFVTYRDGNYTVQSINDPTAKFFDKDVVNRNGNRW